MCDMKNLLSLLILFVLVIFISCTMERKSTKSDNVSINNEEFIMKKVVIRMNLFLI